eukprot:2035981-Alexandrium_andersonii.AAC.1
MHLAGLCASGLRRRSSMQRSHGRAPENGALSEGAAMPHSRARERSHSRVECCSAQIAGTP